MTNLFIYGDVIHLFCVNLSLAYFIDKLLRQSYRIHASMLSFFDSELEKESFNRPNKVYTLTNVRIIIFPWVMSTVALINRIQEARIFHYFH